MSPSGLPSAPPAFETCRPFTRAAAIAAGISPTQLRGSRFRRIFRRVYVDARVPDRPIRAEAALLLHALTAYASHVTAARVRGLPVPVSPDEHVSVRSPGERSRRDGITCHVGRPTELVRVQGVLLSGPHQMFVELASVLSLVDLVVVGDALVRTSRVTPESLAAACEGSEDRYAAHALRAARLVREDVDSPMETRLRLLLVLAGLPQPEVNHKIRDVDGRVLRRFDLSYPGVRLIVEYDGRQHVEVRDQWLSDLDRPIGR